MSLKGHIGNGIVKQKYSLPLFVAMPATRVTVALNAKQSQRSVLLVPASASCDPSDPTSARSLVFKAAQSKLRLKKPLRIYVASTGQELLSEADWQDGVKDDVTLLVSAGEEYVGLRKEVSSKHRELWSQSI